MPINLAMIYTYLFQLSGESGVPLQFSFLFYTVGIIPLLVATLALLPKTRLPWPISTLDIEHHESLTKYVRNNAICRTVQGNEFAKTFVWINDIVGSLLDQHEITCSP